MSKASPMKKLSILVGILFLTFIIPGFFKITAHAQTANSQANIIVETIPQSSLVDTILEKIKISWPWYLTRASGLIAGLVFFILMLSGVGFITGHAFKFLEPITAWATHRALGIMLGIALFFHIFALYFDHFIPFDMKSLFVPFVSTYKPVEIFGVNFGSLYVALGVLAFYIIIAIILTSLFLINKKPKTWKIVHLLSYIAVVLIFVHALYIGTDLAHGIMRYIWIGLMIVLGWAGLVRLRRVKTL